VEEAQTLELEMARLREENADLRRRIGETSALEAAKKRADARAEQLEEKVCGALHI
jgi:homeobox protein cut-like